MWLTIMSPRPVRVVSRLHSSPTSDTDRNDTNRPYLDMHPVTGLTSVWSVGGGRSAKP